MLASKHPNLQKIYTPFSFPIPLKLNYLILCNLITSHHPAVFVDKGVGVAADEVEQGCAVADVLGDVARPGGDGIGVKGAGISPQEKPQRNGKRDAFVVVAVVVSVGEDGGAGEAVPGRKLDAVEKGFGHGDASALVAGEKPPGFHVHVHFQILEVYAGVEKGGFVIFVQIIAD